MVLCGERKRETGEIRINFIVYIKIIAYKNHFLIIHSLSTKLGIYLFKLKLGFLYSFVKKMSLIL